MGSFKELLKKTEQSQARLAETLGVSPQTVNRWAVGKLPAPKAVVLYLSLLVEFRALRTQLKGEFDED